jgi:beta-glucosidase
MSLFSALALLSLYATTNAQIQNDTHWYGQSPHVDPPIAVGVGSWSEAYSKAQALVSQMTVEEKVNLTGGISMENSCSGNIPGVPRLGFEGLCLSDAGQGVRATDFVSGFPSGISVGARQVYLLLGASFILTRITVGTRISRMPVPRVWVQNSTRRESQ